jgi:protein TonB
MNGRRAIRTLAGLVLLSVVFASSALAVTPYAEIVAAHAKRQVKFFLDHYPRTRSGIVRVVFALDSGGNVLHTRVSHSSGNAELDKLAVDVIRRAAPYPAAQGRRNHLFEVPLNFSVQPNTKPSR